jgi:hypothetical protein
MSTRPAPSPRDRMSASPLDGITVTNDGDRVVVEVAGGRWEGSAAEAERLLTGLHYAIGRARPGTTIVSLFLDESLWGAKTVEPDPARALAEARQVLDDLAAHVDRLIAQRRLHG